VTLWYVWDADELKLKENIYKVKDSADSCDCIKDSDDS